VRRLPLRIEQQFCAKGISTAGAPVKSPHSAYAENVGTSAANDWNVAKTAPEKSVY